jgi:diguanylate cyclase (GGDEF)-like protein
MSMSGETARFLSLYAHQSTPDHDRDASWLSGGTAASRTRARENGGDIERAKSGARRKRISGLLAEPPLIDRISWREGVSPRTLISQDTGLMARTFGTLFMVAALVGGLSLLVSDNGNRDDVVLGVISYVSLLLSVLLFVVYRRTPIWAFQMACALGSVMIAVAAAGGSSGAEGGYAIFYVWVVLLAFLFFSFPAATGQAAFAALSYAVILVARGTEFGFNFELGLVAVAGAAGAIVGMLRSRVERLASNLADQANTDPVTAIANRRSFESRFDFELMTAEEADRPLSLVVCDLDRFKAVNDELGHEEGDAALRLAAGTIVRAVRSVDVVFRMGGEEFAVLLPNTEALEAYAVAERLRLAIREAFQDFEVPVTVSCGLATRFAGGPDRKELLRAADHALYHAKRAGRDRTVSHDPSVDYSFEASPVK